MNRDKFKRVAFWPIVACALAIVVVVNTCRRVAVIRMEPELTSVIRLIASPEAYHDRHVTTVGVLGLGFESTALYLNETDHAKHIAPNAVWLSLDEAQIAQYRALEGEYVMVEGRFSKASRGHLNIYIGSIESIVGIVPVPTPESFR